MLFEPGRRLFDGANQSPACVVHPNNTKTRAKAKLPLPIVHERPDEDSVEDHVALLDGLIRGIDMIREKGDAKVVIRGFGLLIARSDRQTDTHLVPFHFGSLVEKGLMEPPLSLGLSESRP